MDELWPLVTNPEALAVSQSWHGHPGRLVDQDVDNAGKAWQAWSKPQDKGAVAVLLIARALDMGTDLPPIDLSLRLSEYVDVTKGAPHVRDIWNRRDVDATQAVDGMLHFRNVTAHDSVFLRITPA